MNKMFPKTHFLINLLLSAVLLPVMKPLYVLIFFLSSFLIDIDHYFYYIFEKKNFSLRKAYKWHCLHKSMIRKLSREERKKHFNFILIFHGIEPLLAVFLLSKLFPILFFIFLGFLVHLIEDLIEGVAIGIVRRKLFLTDAIYYHYKSRTKDSAPPISLIHRGIKHLEKEIK